MGINDIKHLAAERIWLVPMAEDGGLHYVWCDDPAPGFDMDPAEAVEYVRKDVHEARIAELEREVELHKAAEHLQISLREKAEEERDALAAHVERLRHECSEAAIVLSECSNLHTLADCLISAANKTPTTSLARLDLIKQAEALEYRADCIMAEAGYLENFPREVAGILRNDAKDKRQQAEASQ